MIEFLPITDEIIKRKVDILFPTWDLRLAKPANILHTESFTSIQEQIKNFKVRKDDVWMVSYPRTGSTWALEMIWLLKNNLNFEAAAKEIQLKRIPVIEMSSFFNVVEAPSSLPWGVNPISYIDELPSPRFIKTHASWDLLPTDIKTVKPKIIYTSRNIKDTIVSCYHHFRSTYSMTDDFESFCELHLSGSGIYGCPVDHMLQFWMCREEPNILFLKYEDMKRDIHAAIRRCAKFLEIDKPLQDDDVERLAKYLSFEEMQSNPAVNYRGVLSFKNENFIRKGMVGEWKNHMSDDLAKRFDEYVERKTVDTGLSFECEI